MHFDLNDEQKEMRRSARRFLRERAPSTKMRTWIETERVLDADLWKRLTQELGWTGIPIPEQAGGYGFTWLDFALILEECGRALLPAPIWTTVALGAGSILALGTEAQHQEWLPAIASGEHIATLAYQEKGQRQSLVQPTTTVRQDGDVWVLDGVKEYVPWAHAADVLVVTATHAAGELVALVVPATQDGVTIERIATMDATRPQGRVTLDNVRLPHTAWLHGAADTTDALQQVLHRAAILLSAELLGVAEAAMEISVEYANERVQFGKPIGTFQAIKHKCANMLMYVEACRSAVWYAGWEASQKDQDLTETAHVTKGYASDISYRITADMIQVLGGIGITWEHDAHFYFKRARAAAQMLGNTAQHREALYQNIIAPSQGA